MRLKSLLIITIFKNVIENETIKLFISLLFELDKGENSDNALKIYSNFINSLYNSRCNINLYEYIRNLIYIDKNIISENNIPKYSTEIINTAIYELTLLNKLLEYDYKKIKGIFKIKYPDISDIADYLPKYSTEGRNNFDINDIINSYNKNGYGIFADSKAFKYTEEKAIIPVKHFNAMTFDELKNYEYQKNIIKNNTKAFLEGKDANNILLYGDRGCGKSSTVKALINEFADYNLKIIQVCKESFMHLSDLFEEISNLPLKFIIFADDISFDENDKYFSSVKAVLEGSLSDRPKNTIIYATTNRMHLVKESFSAREGNEIHYNDTIDEQVSLSDRFGLMLTFSLLTKNEYLDIVKQIAKDYCLEINDDLYKKAEEFAALKSIRTPRTARQFITDFIANNYYKH